MPKTITITIKATQDQPFPPIISDGTNTSDGTADGDKTFETTVDPGDRIDFVVSTDSDNVISRITSISNNAKIFTNAPGLPSNGNWQATAAATADIGSYDISYEIKFTYKQDPRIKIK